LETTKGCEDAVAPVVLLAQEVNECDDIPGWRGTKEILMSEEEASGGREWVIIVSPGSVSTVMRVENNPSPIAMENPKNNGVQDRMDIDIDVDLHQIKAGHRYETNSRSEIRGGVVAFSLTAASRELSFLANWEDFGPGDRKIHKDDIAASTVFTDDLNAFTIPASIFMPGVCMVFNRVYEHDWYATDKVIPIPLTCGPPSWLSTNYAGNMKYSHEFYFSDCGFANAFFFQTGDQRIIENAKCKFVLKRTN
jgi:hypothetical protein